MREKTPGCSRISPEVSIPKKRKQKYSHATISIQHPRARSKFSILYLLTLAFLASWPLSNLEVAMLRVSFT